MTRFIFRRILWLIPVLLFVSLITFTLMHITPGGPWDKEKVDVAARQPAYQVQSVSRGDAQQVPARKNTIGDDQLLFGPGSLGLDSVDALQLVVALDKNFGLKVADPVAAKEILQSVNSMVIAVQRNGA